MKFPIHLCDTLKLGLPVRFMGFLLIRLCDMSIYFTSFWRAKCFNKYFFFKEKLCHEIAGGLSEDIIAQKIRPELDKVEGELYALEREEHELRRVRLEINFLCY